MTKWSVRCTWRTKPWKYNVLLQCRVYTVFHYGMYDKFIFAIRLSPYRLFDFERCECPVYRLFVCHCVMLLLRLRLVLVVHLVASSVSCTVVNIADFRLINDCHTLNMKHSVAVIAIFSLRLFTCIPYPLCRCRARPPYFPIYTVNWALVIEILSQASLLRHVMDVLKCYLLRQLSIPLSNEQTSTIQIFPY